MITLTCLQWLRVEQIAYTIQFLMGLAKPALLSLSFYSEPLVFSGGSS